MGRAVEQYPRKKHEQLPPFCLVLSDASQPRTISFNTTLMPTSSHMLCIRKLFQIHNIQTGHTSCNVVHALEPPVVRPPEPPGFFFCGEMKVRQSHRPEIVHATPDGKPAAPGGGSPSQTRELPLLLHVTDGGVSPSEPRAPGNSNMVEGTARAATHAKIEPHRRHHVCSTRWRIKCFVACFGPRQLGDESLGLA